MIYCTGGGQDTGFWRPLKDEVGVVINKVVLEKSLNHSI